MHQPWARSDFSPPLACDGGACHMSPVLLLDCRRGRRAAWCWPSRTQQLAPASNLHQRVRELAAPPLLTPPPGEWSGSSWPSTTTPSENGRSSPATEEPGQEGDVHHHESTQNERDAAVRELLRRGWLARWRGRASLRGAPSSSPDRVECKASGATLTPASTWPRKSEASSSSARCPQVGLEG